jgi:hypothetical protein
MQDITSSAASINAASHVASFEDTWDTDINKMTTIVQLGGDFGQVMKQYVRDRAHVSSVDFASTYTRPQTVSMRIYLLTDGSVDVLIGLQWKLHKSPFKVTVALLDLYPCNSAN